MGLFKRKPKEGEEKPSTEKEVGTRERFRNLWKSSSNDRVQETARPATASPSTPQTTVQKDLIAPPTESIPVAECSVTEADCLWDLAYDALKEEYAEKMEQYERVLSSRDLHGGM